MEAYQRIEKLITYLNLNKNSFSKEIGYSQNTTIGRIINEKRKPSEKVLRKIINRFPDVNYDWLLTGKGKMLKNSDDNPVESFLGMKSDISVDDFIDIFFLHQDDIEKHPRFERYLQSVRKDAIIDYQHTLLTDGKKINDIGGSS